MLLRGSISSCSTWSLPTRPLRTTYPSREPTSPEDHPAPLLSCAPAQHTNALSMASSSFLVLGQDSNHDLELVQPRVACSVSTEDRERHQLLPRSHGEHSRRGCLRSGAHPGSVLRGPPWAWVRPRGCSRRGHLFCGISSRVKRETTVRSSRKMSRHAGSQEGRECGLLPTVSARLSSHHHRALATHCAVGQSCFPGQCWGLGPSPWDPSEP